jgi:hypothetical protein
MGTLSGFVGGAARAIWAFIVEIRSFEIYHRTGKPPIAMTRLFGEPVEYWFDFMWVWYLYLMKPVAGATLGFVFAVLVGYDVIPLQDSSEGHGTIVVSWLAGFFAEDAIDSLGRVFRRFQKQDTRTTDGA